jgi:hypothetical protein
LTRKIFAKLMNGRGSPMPKPGSAHGDGAARMVCDNASARIRP